MNSQPDSQPTAPTDGPQSTSVTPRPEHVNRERFEPIAGILAIVFPGGGHLYLREYWRGIGVAVGVLGLFFGGLLIGGIDSVDSREDRIWFIGQALVGPIAFGVDYAHQNWYKGYGQTNGGAQLELRTANPDETREMRPDASGNVRPMLVPGNGARPPNTKSLAHVNEIGTLYATIAGMLNLIAILDALFHREHREEVPA